MKRIRVVCKKENIKVRPTTEEDKEIELLCYTNANMCYLEAKEIVLSGLHKKQRKLGSWMK